MMRKIGGAPVLLLCCAVVAVVSKDSDDLFSRHDKESYLSARGGSDASAIEHLRNRFEQAKKHGGGIALDDQEDDECTVYLAPSSIPNSGLGMYTTRKINKGELFHLPEVGVALRDRVVHFTSGGDGTKLLNQYPWSHTVLNHGTYETSMMEGLVPGIGMLANSHLGLVNMRHQDSWKTETQKDSTDSFHYTESLTMDDVGRGSYSTHGNVVFEASNNLAAGEELFVSYGVGWFDAREGRIGVVPDGVHFKEADQMLRSFFQKYGNEKQFELHRQYKILLDEAEHKIEDTSDNTVEKRDAKKVRAALPNSLKEAYGAIDLGSTARWSAKDSIREIDWLKEHVCIDNIRSYPSTLPNAGRGAFSTRSIKEGDAITTTPLITIERDELMLWGDNKSGEQGSHELIGHQQLLNYCYGHRKSSLLFFPYSPVLNFVNHGGPEKSNAEMRWSTYSQHKSDWLTEPLDRMKTNLKTGLMFDLVATRNIKRGEEVLIDYGRDWEDRWQQHMEDWGSGTTTQDNSHNMTDYENASAVFELNRNSVVRTVEEQQSDPYPAYITTICTFNKPEGGDCSGGTGEVKCSTRWDPSFDTSKSQLCEIISRRTIQGRDWYTASVNIFDEESGENMIEFIARDAIHFIHKPYTKDQYANEAFRHEIGLPLSMMPEQWLDLKGDELYEWPSAEDDKQESEDEPPGR